MSQKSAISATPIIPYPQVLLTRDEVCELLRCCPKTLWNMRKQRRIPFIRRGRTILFRRIDVEEYLQARLVAA